jgi:hypothetical protein
MYTQLIIITRPPLHFKEVAQTIKESTDFLFITQVSNSFFSGQANSPLIAQSERDLCVKDE